MNFTLKAILIALACIAIGALAFVTYVYTTYCTGGGHGIC